MGNVFFFEWEIELIYALQHIFDNGFFVALGSFLTLFGEEIILVGIMGFLYWSYDKEYGKYVGLNVAVATVWNPMIKNVFLRKRPYFVSHKIKCLKPVEADADVFDIAAQGYSFPSGHSMNSATVYGSVAVRGKKKWLWAVAVVMPLLVGFSRFYLGVHFPTDVLVGWICGAILIAIFSILHRKIANKLILYGLCVLSGIPGLFYCTSDDYFTAMGVLIGACAGFIFEDKFVKFSNTKKNVRRIIRVVGGGVVYAVLNNVLKLPFSKEFLHSGTTAAHMVRLGRYAVVIFIMIAIYPMIFKFGNKLFKED